MSNPRLAPSLIFVVEDQEILRMEAVTLLQDAGYETIEAANADAALEVMERRWREIRGSRWGRTAAQRPIATYFPASTVAERELTAPELGGSEQQQ